MKHNKLIYIALFIIFFSTMGSKTAFAKEGAGLGYTVQAIPSTKQIDPEKTYFYITTAPGEEEELRVTVKSTQKEEVKIKIYATDAFTGDAGTIEYTKDPELLDETLKNPITSMTKIETPTITVSNFEEKEAIIKVTPPNESYAGIKMGALVFALDADEKGAVKNNYEYKIGLMTAETGDDFKDGKTLNLLDAKSTLKLGKKMIVATLQNPEPKILSNLQINAEVKEKSKNEVVKRSKVDNYSMAANSHFDFGLDWGTSKVKEGTYILTMQVSNSFNDWQFEKEFTISGEQAKKMNDASGFKIITPTWIKVVTILLSLTMLSIMATLLARRKKMEAEWKKRKKRKKRRNKKKKEGG